MHIPGCQKNGVFHTGIQKNRAIHILFVEKRGPIIYLAALKKGAIRHEHPYYAIYRKLPPPPSPTHTHERLSLRCSYIAGCTASSWARLFICCSHIARCNASSWTRLFLRCLYIAGCIAGSWTRLFLRCSCIAGCNWSSWTELFLRCSYFAGLGYFPSVRALHDVTRQLD